MNPDMLLGHMRDIRGLDAVSWWPLATGWWLLVALTLVLAAALYFGRIPWMQWRRRGREQWRREALKLLDELERQIDAHQSTKESATRLSELMRRIALARCSRDSCAGLEGEKWLAFLTDNDPERFDWPGYRALLLQAPYAPPATLEGDKTASDLKTLVGAARAWTRQTSPCIKAPRIKDGKQPAGSVHGI